LKASHFSDCPQQQSSLKNQNNVSDQDIGTCKDPLLQSGSILTALIADPDHRGGKKGTINHVYKKTTA